MKKIFPILLTVVLIFILAIPTFATDSEYVIKAGTYSFKDNPSPVEGIYSVPLPISFTYNELDYTASYFAVGGDDSEFVIGFQDVYLNGEYTEGFIVYISSGDYTEWINDLSFDVRQDTTVTLAEYNLFNEYVTLHTNECDGSACPANDANLDGVCDDCGMPLTMSLRSTTLDSLILSAPYYNYFIYKTVDSNGAYVDMRLSFVSSNSPMTVTKAEWDRLNDDAWGTVSFRFEGDSDIDGVNYVSTDGGTTWQRETTYSNGTTLFSVDENFVKSTFDFYDRDTGELFFPLPLWEITQGVATETVMGVTLPTLGETLMILMACGIGLLALVLIFGILRKVFSTFRVT